MRLLRLTLTLALMVLSTTAWCMTPTTNYDFEDGFTDGVANGWEAYLYDGSPVACSESTTVHNGAKAQRVETGGEGGVKAKFATTPGVAYRVTVWCKRESGVPFVAVGANAQEDPLDASLTWQQLNAETTDWQSASAEVTPTGDGITIFLDVWAGACHWDDVTVEEVNTLPTSPYYRIYSQTSELVGGGNIYFTGGVYDGKVYTGHLSQCAQLWGDEQVEVPVWTYDYWDGLAWVPALTTSEPSARVSMTQPWMPVGLYGPLQWGRPVAKCSIPLGGWIYMAGGGTAMFKTAGWWNGLNQPEISVVDTPGGEIVDCLATDGQYIFATIHTMATPKRVNTLYKYTVDTVTGNVSNAAGWPKAISGVTALTGISYYGGKIYAVDSGAPYGIYEIDAGTGDATKLADFVYPNSTGSDTQVVRYGNELFVVCGATACHRLYTYTLNAGVWSATSSYLVSTNDDGVNPLDVYGVAVMGDGTKATHAWVTSEGANMQFFGLADPWAGSPVDLAAVAWKNGHRAYATNAVVTAIGAGGFWIEDVNRTAAAHVLYIGAPPDLNTRVTIKGMAGRTASGERTLDALDIVAGTVSEVKPLFLTNKSMGLASGGAGLANDGMLVTVCGRVSHYDPSTEAFYIDDGSGVASDIPSVKGVKVMTVDELGVYGVPNLDRVQTGLPSYAKVTGVVRLEKLADGTIIRVIAARSDADVVITAL